MGISRLRFASAFPALFLLGLAATALAAGGGAKTGAPHGADPAVIAQAPTESAGQGGESFEAIEARFLVQQAVDAGLDTERARRMSAILLAFRKNRLEILDLIGQGKITRAEMRKRARKHGVERRKKLKALLGEKIYAALDRSKAESRAYDAALDRRRARSRAAGVGMGRLSSWRASTGERLVEYCNGRPIPFCTGYISALVDIASDPDGWGPAQRICIPDQIIVARPDPAVIIAHAVLDYLAKTPAARAKVGFEAVAEALAAEFPC